MTAEDCRVRFAQLDREEGPADDESEVDQGDTCEKVVYGVAAPGVLENAGLSFAELEHRARNMKSRYPCVALPLIGFISPDLQATTHSFKGEAITPFMEGHLRQNYVNWRNNSR